MARTSSHAALSSRRVDFDIHFGFRDQPTQFQTGVTLNDRILHIFRQLARKVRLKSSLHAGLNASDLGEQQLPSVAALAEECFSALIKRTCLVPVVQPSQAIGFIEQTVGVLLLSGQGNRDHEKGDELATRTERRFV